MTLAFEGYKTSSDSNWIFPVLENSDNITVLSKPWTNGFGDDLFAVGTDSDLVIINKTRRIQVGYVTISGGPSCLYYLNNVLYVGVNTVGLKQIDLSTINTRAENSDLSSVFSTLYTNVTSPALYSNNVVSIYAWLDSNSHVWLAIACCDNSRTTGDNRVTIIDVNNAVSYNSSSRCFGSNIQIKGFGGSEIKFVCDHFIHSLYNAESINTDNWHFDATIAGCIENQFDGSNESGLTINYLTPSATGGFAETGGSLELTVVGAADNSCVYNALFSGDFDINIEFNTIDSGLALNKYYELQFGVYIPNSFTGPAGNHYGDYYVFAHSRRIRDGGGSYSARTGWGYLAGVASDFNNIVANSISLRIAREGDTFTVYTRADVLSSWILRGTYTSMSTNPAMIYLWQSCNDSTSASLIHQVRYINTNWTGSETCYSNSLPISSITDFDLSNNTSVAGTTTAVLGFDSGVWLVDTNESVIRSSEGSGNIHGLYTTTTGSGSIKVINGSSDQINAVAISPAGAPTIGARTGTGQIVVGTSDGISIIDLGTDTLNRACTTSSTQPVVDNNISELEYIGSWLYATPSTGCGFLGDAPLKQIIKMNTLMNQILNQGN